MKGEDRGSRIEDRGSRIEDRGSRIWISRMGFPFLAPAVAPGIRRRWSPSVSIQIMFNRIPLAEAGGSFNPYLQKQRKPPESRRRKLGIVHSLPTKAKKSS